MTRLSVAKAREQLDDLLDRVATKRERFVLHRRGKEVALLLPLDDEIAEALEDWYDVKCAEEALAEPGPNISFEDLRHELSAG